MVTGALAAAPLALAERLTAGRARPQAQGAVVAMPPLTKRLGVSAAMALTATSGALTRAQVAGMALLAAAREVLMGPPVYTVLAQPPTTAQGKPAPTELSL